jgi:hypothetical protein
MYEMNMRKRKIIFSSNLMLLKKSHIGYEMALTSLYKQVVVLTLPAGL